MSGGAVPSEGEIAPLRWSLATTAAGAVSTPSDLPVDLHWMEASVPGTVAGALAAGQNWSLDSPRQLHDQDYWYATRFSGEGGARLVLEGLATVTEVWLNGARILETRNMFAAHNVDVKLIGSNELHLCFRSLDAALGKVPARPRARWRPRMISSQALRAIRSTLIGHMPGWCPPVHVIGPWRPIHLVADTQQTVLHCEIRTETVGREGLVHARIRLAVPCTDDVVLRCGEASIPLESTDGIVWAGRLTVPDIETWWPHTHGTPKLYPLSLRCGDALLPLGQTGFRSIEIDRGHDGNAFQLKVNGVPIFCRGAIWTSADLIGMSGARSTYLPWLTKLRDAHLNMVRIPGTMVYEAQAFYDLCDELGILVWQDFMFANFDYPATSDAFLADVAAEADTFLSRTQTSPCLAVFCGGSEVHQQATMLGYPPSVTASRLFDETLPQAIDRWRPDVPYVANSPCGHPLPFSVSSGVAHYFGVGAYLRPLDDARRASVRFASECLAFASIPEAVTLEQALPVPAVHHPRWKERTPRDQGASWDFDDVRDHYLETLYEVDARLLRLSDPERYVHASRAVVADIFEATLSEWRRTGSVTAGALVLSLQDLWVGAGWGILDSRGEPKSPWLALRRVCQPVAVVITDEGLDGLALHLVNETATDRHVRLELQCLRDGRTAVVNATRELTLSGRETRAMSSTDIIGQFFDITGAYRFGPLSHDVSIVSLYDQETGSLISQAFHLPTRRLTSREDVGLRATIERTQDGNWMLALQASKFARHVWIDDRHFRPEDNYFHLVPAEPRRIALYPREGDGTQAAPAGDVMALNGNAVVRYGSG